jgi:hypothetical protein
MVESCLIAPAMDSSSGSTFLASMLLAQVTLNIRLKRLNHQIDCDKEFPK